MEISFVGLEEALLEVQEITQKYVEMFRELGIELDELMTNFRGQFKHLIFLVNLTMLFLNVKENTNNLKINIKQK